MKKYFYPFIHCALTLLFMSVLIPGTQAQYFHLYGHSAEQHFTHVIPDQQGYYLMGQEGTHAIIGHTDLSGQLQWIRKFNVPSGLLDGKVESVSGDLLFVGLTFPFPNQSLIGRIDAANSVFMLKTFDSPGNEGLGHLEHLSGQDYLALGWHASATPEDMVLYEITAPAAGGFSITQKRQFSNSVGERYGNNLCATGPASFLYGGHDENQEAVMYHYDINGLLLGAAQGPSQYEYVDFAVIGGDFIGVANSMSGGLPYVVRFDQNFIPVWETHIFGLSSITQVLVDANDRIYIVGEGASLNQRVVVALENTTCFPFPCPVWTGSKARYIENGSTQYTGGYLALVTGQPLVELAFVDGRTGPVGFGMDDGFLALTDGHLNSTLCLQEHQIDLAQTSVLFNGPVGDTLAIVPVPPLFDETAPQQMWQETPVCDSDVPFDTCICPVQPHLMTLTQNGIDYGVGCRPHGFQDPVIGCPPGDIVISGFYGCIDPVTLEPCSTESVVKYELYGPNGHIYGGTTTNYPSLFFPSADVDDNGHYTLILSTLCPGAVDSCICVLDWDLDCDTCCQDMQTFCDRIENNVFIVVDPMSCKVTMNIGDLFVCDSIRDIDWGVPGGYDPGPYGSQQMPMFTYTGSGTYIISYLATETDPNTGFLCFEKWLYDTITIDCGPPLDTCQLTCPTRQWNALSADYFVQDMVVYNGRLILGGSFNFSGANHIVAWDGTNWILLGTGMNAPVEALAVYNGELYAGGGFTMAGTIPVSGIAKWNGSVWMDPGGGVSGGVLSLQVHNGSLIAGGSFTMAGGNPATNIARWNGTQWSPLAGGINGDVFGLGLYNNDLIAGGVFNSPGNNIAKWDGSTWTPLSGGIHLYGGNMGQGVKAILQYGSDLIVGGRYMDADGATGTQHMARWDGLMWHSMATGVNTSFEGIYDLILYDGDLYAGGLYTQIGGSPISGVAKWDGSNWSDVQHQNQLVRALAQYQAPTATAHCDLYSAGEVFVNVWDCLTSTDDLAFPEIGVYPNPTEGLITIDISEISSSDLQLRIIDVNGRIVNEQMMPRDVTRLDIDARGFATGMYHVQIVRKGQMISGVRFVRH